LVIALPVYTRSDRLGFPPAGLAATQRAWGL